MLRIISPLVTCLASARNDANENDSKFSFFDTNDAE